MKNYILYYFLSTVIFSVSCKHSNPSVSNNSDTTVSGNTDSFGSQPLQPGPGAVNGGNATDTIARRNEPAPGIDSVVRH